MSLLVRYQDHVALHLWFNEETVPKKELKTAAHGSKLIGWVSHSLSPVIERWGGFCNRTHGFTGSDAITMAIDLLGVSLEEEAEEVCSCRGAYSRLDWLEVIFTRRQDESIFDCAARAYMELLILLGATSLVTLYKYLGDASFYTCKQLGGYAFLLQFWIHEYFPIVGKRGFFKIVVIGSPFPREMKWMYKQAHRRLMSSGLCWMD
ncbi:uncharacterized protein LOC127131916 [Lathyrus oleraceus]|uniref:uncharacterized protein LOC127131916 n=1 Tax=Pisum sativum TaxID=3888 RepID=UPI0021D33BCF|nr:uncharacterized protein LOC127131916 [Pisum sativum]